MKKEKVPIFWSKYKNPAYGTKLTAGQKAGIDPVEGVPRFLYKVDESRMTLENIEKFRRALANKAESFKVVDMGQRVTKPGEQANFNAWNSLEKEISRTFR